MIYIILTKLLWLYKTKKVWDLGGKRGHARGIPIAMVDYLTAGLAG